MLEGVKKILCNAVALFWAHFGKIVEHFDTNLFVTLACILLGLVIYKNKIGIWISEIAISIFLPCCCKYASKRQ